MRAVFSNFRMRLFRYAKNTQNLGGPMSIVMAVVLSMFLLTVTGCATSSPPPAAKQEMDKKVWRSRVQHGYRSSPPQWK